MVLMIRANLLFEFVFIDRKKIHIGNYKINVFFRFAQNLKLSL